MKSMSNLFITNLSASNTSSTNLIVTNLLNLGITSTNLRTTSSTITNLVSSSITSTNLLATNNIISNGMIYSRGKFSISSTFVTYGDSYTSGAGSESSSNWPTMLSTLSGKSVINNAISATTIDYLTTTSPQLMQDVVANSAYNNYSYIVGYGFNDVRNINGLYTETNIYQWYQVYLNVIITMAMKQENIYGAKTGWTESGSWLDTPVNSYGRYTSTTGATTTKTITGRYYMFSFIIASPATSLSWEIKIDGVTVCSPKVSLRTTSSGGTYYNVCSVVDMKTNSARSVQVKNNGTNGQFFDYCASWNSSSSFRPVLCCSIPMFDFAFTGSSPWNAGTSARWNTFNTLIQQAVITCQNLGLPVYFYNDSNPCCFDADGVHWSDGAYYQRASGINNILNA